MPPSSSLQLAAMAPSGGASAGASAGASPGASAGAAQPGPHGWVRDGDPPAPALGGAPLIALHGAAVAFGATQALKPLDLTLHRGECLALVGANGSGKTTLLRLLHGLLPHQGRREVHPIAGPGGPAEPVVAMLFQHPFLLHLSVWQNLRLALWLRRWPKADRAARCAQALARVGLAGEADRPARALSGGQQQRLALARAWAMRPDLLLLDEPTASLDPGAKREVEALVADLHREGMTVVLTTHNLGQAKRLADRVAYLEAGRLVVIRPTDAFFEGPLPPEAASFLSGELAWR